MSLTDVGNDYLLAAAPALSQLRQAAEEASGRGGRPAGPLRLTMPRAPFDLLIAEAMVAFQDAYPDVELEIAVEARMIDIVKQGYDAGLRYGNNIEKDMVAVPVAPRSEAVLVGSPAYLHARSIPNVPGDLLNHRAVMCRSQATGSIIPWTLQSAGETVQIAPTSGDDRSRSRLPDRAGCEGAGHSQRASRASVRPPRRRKVVAHPARMVLPAGGALPLLPEPSSPISGIARVRRVSEGSPLSYPTVSGSLIGGLYELDGDVVRAGDLERDRSS